MHRPVFKFVSYDATKYCFANLFASHVFRVKNLSLLHETILSRKLESGKKAEITYEDNLAARELLKQAATSAWFWKVYRAFAINVIAPVFGNKLTYNWPPVFRVHMAGSPSISAWHRDVEVTGRDDLITVWIPFTDTFDTNSIWVETEYDSRKYASVEVKNGQALLFDSGYLWHGSVNNTTNITRVSMDFRVAPKRQDLKHPDLGILSARPPGMKVEINPQLSKNKSNTEYYEPDITIPQGEPIHDR